MSKILIINNDPRLSDYLELTLKDYTISKVSSSYEALTQLRASEFDLVILKSNMPDMRTKELIKEIKTIRPSAVIILILEEGDSELISEFNSLGVYEFLRKPLNLDRLNLLAKKGIELHSILMNQAKNIARLLDQNTILQKQNLYLSKRVEELTKNLTRLYDNLRTTYIRTIRALAQALDARDHYTHSHSENVARYAVKIAEAMNLSAHEIDVIRSACELHDIGKIGIPDNILTKEDTLTPEEEERIKEHALKGAQILEPLDFMKEIAELVRQHHENYDGTGYPDGHKKDEIPLGARIIRLADAYDAMTSARAYRKNPLSKQEAIEEIKRNSGTQFDPQVVEAFLKIVDEL